jgi:hypothetical protein
MAIASLILGIFSIIFAFTGPISFIGIILGAVGIVLGVLARKKEPSDVATGGLVTSIIGCVVSLLLNLACIACIYGGMKMFDEPLKNPQMPVITKSLEDLAKGLKEMEKDANKPADKNKK